MKLFRMKVSCGNCPYLFHLNGPGNSVSEFEAIVKNVGDCNECGATDWKLAPVEHVRPQEVFSV